MQNNRIGSNRIRSCPKPHGSRTKRQIRAGLLTAENTRVSETDVSSVQNSSVAPTATRVLTTRTRSSSRGLVPQAIVNSKR